MKKNNSGSYVAISLFVIVGCFLITWQMIVPRLKVNKTDLSQTKAEITSAQEKLDSLKTAQTSLTELGALVDQIFVAVPDGVDAPNLLSELEAIASNSQTYIPTIDFRGNKSSTSSTLTTVAGNTIPLSFSVQGSYANLMSFLASLEKDLRFMNVKTYSLTADDEGEQMTLALELVAYKRQNTSLSSSSAGSATSTASGTEDNL